MKKKNVKLIEEFAVKIANSYYDSDRNDLLSEIQKMLDAIGSDNLIDNLLEEYDDDAEK